MFIEALSATVNAGSVESSVEWSSRLVPSSESSSIVSSDPVGVQAAAVAVSVTVTVTVGDASSAWRRTSS